MLPRRLRPGPKLRPFLVPAAVAPAAEESTRAGQDAASGRAVRTSTPRLDWAGLLERTFKEEVLLCARGGGRRRVVAYLTHFPAVRQVLAHLVLPADTPPLAPARGSP